MPSAGGLVRVQRRDQNSARSEFVNRLNRVARLRQRLARTARQIVQFELVRRNDVGGGHRLLPHELRNAGAHEDAAADIADHGVAAIACRRIGALHRRHGIEDRLADIGAAHITGQHAIARGQHAALRDPGHHIADQCGVEYLALPVAIAGVVGELHGVHWPDLDAEALQRKHRGGIADMAVGDVRLDGEEIHCGQCSGRTGLCRGPSGRQPCKTRMAGASPGHRGFALLLAAAYLPPICLFASMTYLLV